MAKLNTITSSTRPESPTAGEAYFETDTNKIIVWAGSEWTEIIADGSTGLTSIDNIYSVSFDNTNNHYLSISDDDVFSLGDGLGADNAFSISAWFKADSIGTFHLATKDAAGAREWAFRTISSELTFFAFGTGGGYIGRRYTNALSSGVWYHAVATYDASKSSSGLKLYLNGQPVDDANYESGTFGSASNAYASIRVCSQQYNNAYSDGKVDELAIFNNELSSQQVLHMYNDGNGPNNISTLNPVGWWRMGDDANDSPVVGGAVASITDSSGNGHTAIQNILSNQPTFSTDAP